MVKLGLLPKKNCYNIGKDDYMKLWLDDVRPAPEGYVWVKSVNEAKDIICRTMAKFKESAVRGYIDEDLYIDIIDLDYDAGDYTNDGGDYIKLLDWLEWLYDGHGTFTEFHIHSMNSVGCANMRRIIERNGWKETK